MVFFITKLQVIVLKSSNIQSKIQMPDHIMIHKLIKYKLKPECG